MNVSLDTSRFGTLSNGATDSGFGDMLLNPFAFYWSFGELHVKLAQWVVAPTGQSIDERLERYALVGILAVPHDQPDRLNEMIGNLPFSTILVVPEWNGLQTVNTRVRDLSGILSLEVRRPLEASSSKQPTARR